MRSLRAAVWLWITLAATTLQAQDVTDVQTDAEVIYPAAIRFTVDVPLAVDDVESAELQLTINGEMLEPIPLEAGRTAEATDEAPAETPTPSDPNRTTLTYVYMLEDGALPRLFEPISYRWTITLTDGNILFADGSVIFEDQRFIWRRIQDSAGMLIMHAPTGVLTLDPIAPDLQAVNRALARIVGSRPPIDWVFYFGIESPLCREKDRQWTAQSPRGDLEVPCNNGIARRLLEQSRMVAIEPDEGSNVRLDLFNRLFDLYWGDAWNDANVPRWFDAGLRRYFLPGSDMDTFSRALTAARTGRLYTLAEMQNPPDTVDPDLYQAEAYGMIMYIIQRIGLEGFYELALGLGQAGDFASLYEARMGEPLARLVSNWERWLFTDAPQVIYAISPYSAPTPTAQPSQPIDTVTPTNTPTVTLTGTATVTLTAEAPPLSPSITATLTASPPVATVTPPARINPTPTPTIVRSPERAENFQLIVLVGAISLIGLLAFVMFRPGSKKP